MNWFSLEIFITPVFLPFITDCVVRTSYYKYFHPKEALISNGVLNRWVPHLWSQWAHIAIYVISVSLLSFLGIMNSGAQNYHQLNTNFYFLTLLAIFHSDSWKSMLPVFPLWTLHPCGNFLKFGLFSTLSTPPFFFSSLSSSQGSKPSCW